MDTAYCTPTVALDQAENVSEAVEEEEDDETDRDEGQAGLLQTANERAWDCSQVR